ncbi:MAG: molecular chaperone HtpG [Simkaniaceae bacterium]|nr:molecular chaperone HtpG [Simkaniaceae bacterium]
MGKLKIHSENILPIIKQWLYSDKDIFLRELVSNACDACAKLKTMGKDDSFAIHITLDATAKTLTISDNGLGMTKDEVENYICQLAFSGAEDFVKQYQDKHETIIGHFGLGFYSAFMVSSLVEIDTLSYKEGSESAHWSCDGGSDYLLETGSRTTRGTTVTLHLSDETYADLTKLKTILKEHCLFLPYPIFLGEERINEKAPLWAKAPSECTDEEYLDFYHLLYPMDPDPIFWIHLNVDYPFHLQGILYFPKITPRFEFQKTNIKLYCNQVFVSENCRDLIPDYLTVLRGVLDSPDIPLNVSRSMLQMDQTVRQLGKHISKKVSDKLIQLATSDRESFVAKWSDIELIIKLGVLQDDKFYERIKECLLFPTVDGRHITVEECKGDKIFYTKAKEQHLLAMYEGEDVLLMPSQLDTPLVNFLESKLSPKKFVRIDGSIDDAILDKTKEKNILGTDGRSEAASIASFFQSHLKGVEVEAKSLKKDSLPAFVMFKEDMRRMRDYFAMHHGETMGAMGDQKTLVVNTNNPLVNATYKLKDKDPLLATSLAEQIYELSLLSQRELDPKEMTAFIQRSNEVLEKLATHATA